MQWNVNPGQLYQPHHGRLFSCSGQLTKSKALQWGVGGCWSQGIPIVVVTRNFNWFAPESPLSPKFGWTLHVHRSTRHIEPEGVPISRELFPNWVPRDRLHARWLTVMFDWVKSSIAMSKYLINKFSMSANCIWWFHDDHAKVSIDKLCATANLNSSRSCISQFWFCYMNTTIPNKLYMSSMVSI